MNPDNATKAEPVIFQRGVWNYRTPQMFILLIVCLAICANFIAAIVQTTVYHHKNAPPAFMIWGGAAVFGILFLSGLTKFVRNTQDHWEINALGVTYKGKAWPWDEVVSLAPQPRSFSKKIWIRVNIGQPSGHPIRILHLRDQHPLEADEYVSQMGDLKKFLDQHHPNVRIDMPSTPRRLHV